MIRFSSLEDNLKRTFQIGHFARLELNDIDKAETKNISVAALVVSEDADFLKIVNWSSNTSRPTYLYTPVIDFYGTIISAARGEKA
jgi:hypothetical protein